MKVIIFLLLLPIFQSAYCKPTKSDFRNRRAKLIEKINEYASQAKEDEKYSRGNVFSVAHNNLQGHHIVPHAVLAQVFENAIIQPENWRAIIIFMRLLIYDYIQIYATSAVNQNFRNYNIQINFLNSIPRVRTLLNYMEEDVDITLDDDFEYFDALCDLFAMYCSQPSNIIFGPSTNQRIDDGGSELDLELVESFSDDRYQDPAFFLIYNFSQAFISTRNYTIFHDIIIHQIELLQRHPLSETFNNEWTTLPENAPNFQYYLQHFAPIPLTGFGPFQANYLNIEMNDEYSLNVWQSYYEDFLTRYYKCQCKQKKQNNKKNKSIKQSNQNTPITLANELDEILNNLRRYDMVGENVKNNKPIKHDAQDFFDCEKCSTITRKNGKQALLLTYIYPGNELSRFISVINGDNSTYNLRDRETLLKYFNSFVTCDEDDDEATTITPIDNKYNYKGDDDDDDSANGNKMQRKYNDDINEIGDKIQRMMYEKIMKSLDDYELRNSVQQHVQQFLNNSCTENVRNDIKNWTTLYQNINQANIKNVGFVQFEDSSYAQQFIDIEDKWYQIDLTQFTGLLSTVSAMSYSSPRLKREIEIPKNQHQKLVSVSSTPQVYEFKDIRNGIVFVDSNGRPTISIIQTNNNTINKFYWTGIQWLNLTLDIEQYIITSGYSIASNFTPTYQRCSGKQSKTALSSLKANNELLLTASNLNIIQREFVRTIQGDGFWYSKFNSWLHAYNTWSWSDIRDFGEANIISLLLLFAIY